MDSQTYPTATAAGSCWRRGEPGLAAPFPRLRHLWVDVGYRGRFVDWVTATLGRSVDIVKHRWTGVADVWVFPGQESPDIPAGFQLLKWCLIVVCTFAWLGVYRRISKDYEYFPETSEAMAYTAMRRAMLASLAVLSTCPPFQTPFELDFIQSAGR